MPAKAVKEPELDPLNPEKETKVKRQDVTDSNPQLEEIKSLLIVPDNWILRKDAEKIKEDEQGRKVEDLAKYLYDKGMKVCDKYLVQVANKPSNDPNAYDKPIAVVAVDESDAITKVSRHLRIKRTHKYQFRVTVAR